MSSRFDDEITENIGFLAVSNSPVVVFPDYMAFGENVVAKLAARTHSEDQRLERL